MSGGGPSHGSARRRALLGCLAAAAILAAAPAAHANEAEIVSEAQYAPRVVELTISTPAFDQPTKVDVNLPTGYLDDPSRRWPVTYFLAGTMNTHRTFNTLIDGIGLTADYPSIVVSPNGDSGYWSDWFNGGAFGPPKYETYVIEQLIDLIDERFRTYPRRSQRAVFGASMGGYGAMMVAARHPDLFSAAATMSGAVNSNLEPHASVLTLSPTFQGAAADSIYGPRAQQEVRWRGHNPWDLAGNLRDLDLQVRTANGILNPAIGEDPLSADTASCVVELGVWAASTSFHDRLTSLGLPHEWRDYGPGCHTRPNFSREVSDILDRFGEVFANPRHVPDSFDHSAIEPDFDIWGWRVQADPERPLEFMRMTDVSAAGLTLAGSGLTTVTSPSLFAGLQSVGVAGGEPAVAIPDEAGRITFTVDLGEPNAQQQFTPGSTTAVTTRTVTFSPGPPRATGQTDQGKPVAPKKCKKKKKRKAKKRKAKKRKRCR